MKYLLLLPLAVQGLAILLDEFHFHFARGLPRWELIGHPLDTFRVLAPILWLVFSVPSERNLIVYIVAAAFSCFFVTKDEFVHADLCLPAEHLNTPSSSSSSRIHWFLPRWHCSGPCITRPPEQSHGLNTFAVWNPLCQAKPRRWHCT